mgnify:CR=1 FL=1
MKYITKYKSPNYNSRNNSKIKLIIIHYTALKNNEEAISYLCKKEKKVSSHYLICQKGKIYNFVDDKFRAWHAGVAFWQDYEDINSISIGIELDYSPNGQNNKFTFQMISSLKKLLIKIQKKYRISKNNILAHSDIAPFRKIDPGKLFPWKSLSHSNIILNLKDLKKSEAKLIEKWFYKYDFKTQKHVIIFVLSFLGYDTRKVKRNLKLYNQLIKSYGIRYIKDKDKINNNLIYNALIKHLFNLLLTKN